DHVEGGPYDLVFSNFGGLNCIPDLREMTRGLPRVLKPGGFVSLVIMPPVCPWELLQALRGDVRTAFRRLHPGGVGAGGASPPFKPSSSRPGRVGPPLGPGYRRVAVRGLSLSSPPSYLERFSRAHPRLFRRLTRLDERLAGLPLLQAMGDF